MSKGLEALEKYKDTIVYVGMGTNRFGGTQEYAVIEKDLKRLEELEKAFKALPKDDEKAKKLLSKEIEKNRALATIVQIFDIKVEKNKLGQCFVSSTNNLFAISQETYDLLKVCCYDIRND